MRCVEDGEWGAVGGGVDGDVGVGDEGGGGGGGGGGSRTRDGPIWCRNARNEDTTGKSVMF